VDATPWQTTRSTSTVFYHYLVGFCCSICLVVTICYYHVHMTKKWSIKSANNWTLSQPNSVKSANNWTLSQPNSDFVGKKKLVW
jgi:hypothetical protein